jgi:hypothetical protein
MLDADDRVSASLFLLSVRPHAGIRAVPAPAAPFVCVLAAAGAVSGVSLLRRFDIPRAARQAVIVGLTTAAPPAGAAIDRLDSRSRAHQHRRAGLQLILDNVPKGSAIVIETQALLLKPGAPNRRTSHSW